MRSKLTFSRRMFIASLLSLIGTERLGATNCSLSANTIFRNRVTYSKWLPITHSNRSLMVKCVINGIPAIAIIDNGATITTIPSKLAGSLNLKAGNNSKIEGWVNNIDSKCGSEISISLGDMTLNIDSPHIIQYPIDSGLEDAVIIGQQLFFNALIDIDMRNNRLRFIESIDATGIPETAEILALRQSEQGLQTIQMAASGHEMTAVFDLGSTSMLSISEEWAEARGLLRKGRTSSWISRDIGGIFEYKVITLDNVRIGSRSFDAVPVDIIPNMLALEPAVFGRGFFEHSRYLVSYKEGRIYIFDYSTIESSTFRKNRSGLACKFEGGTFTVVFIAPGSPGESMGWKEGDMIAQIDDTPITEENFEELFDWGNGNEGNVVSLTMKSGEIRRIKLKNYY